MNPRIVLAAATLQLAMALHAVAADASCAGVLKAVQAGMVQPRIHAAIDAPLDAEAIKLGFKKTLMHSIVIDKLQYSNALDPKFQRVALANADERGMASDLAAFQAEHGCNALGSARLAGRAAQVFALTTDLGRGEVTVRLWVDAASGLPLRAVTDEPDFDVDTVLQRAAKAGAKSRAQVTEKANGQRIVSTHAYLYGDAVKAPGSGGTLDAQALSQLQALLGGAP